MTYKQDKTRLKNLLRNYRDDIITQLNNKLPSGYIPNVKIINDIDYLIDLINIAYS